MPGIRNADANIVKNFSITETVKTTFRCEIFNVFNHPQIWGINTGFSGDTERALISANTKNFGQPSSGAKPGLSNWLFASASDRPCYPAGKPRSPTRQRGFLFWGTSSLAGATRAAAKLWQASNHALRFAAKSSIPCRSLPR